jgi:hypothetical protein
LRLFSWESATSLDVTSPNQLARLGVAKFDDRSSLYILINPRGTCTRTRPPRIADLKLIPFSGIVGDLKVWLCLVLFYADGD